jgi:hypothetical protein
LIRCRYLLVDPAGPAITRANRRIRQVVGQRHHQLRGAHSMKRLSVVLAATVLLSASGASGGDLPLKAMAAPAVPASPVPQSAFFAGLGGSVNSLGFEEQNIYAQGVSNIYLNGTQVAFGSAGGPATPSLDSRTALAPNRAGRLLPAFWRQRVAVGR